MSETLTGLRDRVRSLENEIALKTKQADIIKKDSEDAQAKYQELLNRVIEMRRINEHIHAERTENETIFEQKITELQKASEAKDHENTQLSSYVEDLKRTIRKERDDHSSKYGQLQAQIKRSEIEYRTDVDSRVAQIDRSKKRLKTAKGHFKRLEAEIARISEELERSFQKNTEMAARIQQLKAENKRVTSERDMLNQAFDEIKSENGELQKLPKRNSALANEMDRLHLELDQAHTETQKLDIANKQLVIAGESAQRRMGNQESRIATLKTELEDTKRMNEALKSEMQLLRSESREIDEAVAVKERAENERNEVVAENEALKGAVDSLESANRKLNGELTLLATRIGQEEMNKETVKKECEAMKGEADLIGHRAKEEMMLLNGRIAELEEAKDAALQNNVGLKDELERLKSNHKSLKRNMKTRINELEKMNAQVKGECVELRERNEQLNARNDRLENDARSAEVQLKQTSKANKTLTSKANDVTVTVQDLQAQNRRLTQTIEPLEIQRQKLRSEVDRLKREGQKQQQMIDDIETENRNIKRFSAQSAVDVSTMMARNDGLEADNAQLLTRVNAYQVECQTLSEEVERMHRATARQQTDPVLVQSSNTIVQPDESIRLTPESLERFNRSQEVDARTEVDEKTAVIMDRTRRSLARDQFESGVSLERIIQMHQKLWHEENERGAALSKRRIRQKERI